MFNGIIIKSKKSVNFNNALPSSMSSMPATIINNTVITVTVTTKYVISVSINVITISP